MPVEGEGAVGKRLTAERGAVICEARRVARVLLRSTFAYAKNGDQKELGGLWQLFAPLECVDSLHCAEVDHRVTRMLQIRVEIAKANVVCPDFEAWAFDRLFRRVARTMHLIGDFDIPYEP